MAGRSGFFAEVDEMTLTRARRGDVGALEEVYHMYSPAVFTLATRLCGSIDDGEEVLQETFLEVVRRIGSFRGEGAFGAWLRRVTVSKVLMHHRRRRSRPREVRELEVAEVEGSLTDHPQSGRLDARFDIERALTGLPETTRMVLWLHEVEGMTHAEIARLLGRTASFSKSQLSRGYGRLKRWSVEEGRRNHASDTGRNVGIAGR
jgi:RNA polymerase sigma-70 factor (ECF subfamily)